MSESTRPYTVYSGDECGGDETYNVLKGPNGFECWLTEPEDRSWYRDGNAVVEKLNEYEATLTEKDAEIVALKYELKQDEYKFIRNHDDYHKELVGLREQNEKFQTELDRVMGELLKLVNWLSYERPLSKITREAKEIIASDVVQSWRARQEKESKS